MESTPDDCGDCCAAGKCATSVRTEFAARNLAARFLTTRCSSCGSGAWRGSTIRGKAERAAEFQPQRSAA